MADNKREGRWKVCATKYSFISRAHALKFKEFFFLSDFFSQQNRGKRRRQRFGLRNVLAPRFSCTYMNGKTKQEVGYSSQHLTFKALTYLPRNKKYSRAFTPSFKKVSFFLRRSFIFFTISDHNNKYSQDTHQPQIHILHSAQFPLSNCSFFLTRHISQEILSSMRTHGQFGQSFNEYAELFLPSKICSNINIKNGKVYVVSFFPGFCVLYYLANGDHSFDWSQLKVQIGLLCFLARVRIAGSIKNIWNKIIMNHPLKVLPWQIW